MNGIEDALRLWRHLFGDEVGMLCIATGVRDERGKLPHVKQEFFPYPRTAESAVLWALEKSDEGREVYFCAHLLTGPKREKDDAAPISSLYSDLDGAPVPNSNLTPTAVVESSPGKRQTFLRLTDALPPLVAEQLNKRLTQATGADKSGYDLTQLLRVPGTVNHKYPDRPVVRLLNLDESRSCSPQALDEALPRLEESETDPSPDEDESPVRLCPVYMRMWRGEVMQRKPDGTVDRSMTLRQLAQALARSGATTKPIAEALRNRDVAFGFRKASDRSDGGAKWYLKEAAHAVRGTEKQPSPPDEAGSPGTPDEADSEGSIYSHHIGMGFGGNKSELPIKSVEAVLEETGESVDWIVEGLLARGSLTDFSGLAKRGGKTTFWCHAIVAGAEDVDHGGCNIVAAKYLYLTEQGNNFAEALRESGLAEHPDHVKIVQFKDVPAVQWERLINQAGTETKRRGLDVLVVDTFAVFARLKGSEENDAGPVADRMRVLRLVAQRYNIGVVLIRHAGKDGTPRGSSAFEAEADICATLTRPEGLHDPTVRKLNVIGRYGEWERNIQLKDGRYISLGSDSKIEFNRAVRFIKSVLPGSPAEGLKKQAIMDRREGDDKEITASTLDRALALFVREGDVGEQQLMGKRGKPKVYWLAYKSGEGA